MTPFIDVAAAAIVNASNDVLIAKRATHQHQGDRWEFPGGKLEAGERPEHALVRELQEELGITPSRFRPLITIAHQYRDKAVRLHVFRVEAFTGEPHGHEGQPLVWVAAQQLHRYEFPAANLPIVTAVQLPDRLLVTPEPGDTGDFLASIEQACAHGIRLLQLRAHTVTDQVYRELAVAVAAITERHGCRLLLNRDPQVLAELPCDGWHLSRHQLARLTAADVASRPRWLSASCHDVAEVEQAEKLNADFLLISPVRPTPSHPQQTGLGWPGFAALAAAANRPAFALGGVSADDLATCWAHGGQGIAAMRALWPR